MNLPERSDFFRAMNENFKAAEKKLTEEVRLNSFENETAAIIPAIKVALNNLKNEAVSVFKSEIIPLIIKVRNDMENCKKELSDIIRRKKEKQEELAMTPPYIQDAKWSFNKICNLLFSTFSIALFMVILFASIEFIAIATFLEENVSGFQGSVLEIGALKRYIVSTICFGVNMAIKYVIYCEKEQHPNITIWFRRTFCFLAVSGLMLFFRSLFCEISAATGTDFFYGEQSNNVNLFMLIAIFLISFNIVGLFMDWTSAVYKEKEKMLNWKINPSHGRIKNEIGRLCDEEEALKQKIIERESLILKYKETINNLENQVTAKFYNLFFLALKSEEGGNR